MTRLGVPLSTAIRAGRYKLIEFYEHDEVELYDIVADPYESNDLSKKQAEMANELLALLRTFQLDARNTSSERKN